MAASLGYDTIGGTQENLPQNYKIGCKFTASASFSSSSILAYITGGNAACKVRCGLYSDVAGVCTALIVISSEVTVASGAAAAWVTFTISTQSIVNGTAYWPFYWTNDPAGTPATIAYDAGAAGQETYRNETYSTGSNPVTPWVSDGTNARKLSIYAAVDPVVAAAGEMMMGIA